MAANLAVVMGLFVGLTLLQFVSFQTLFVCLSIITFAAALSALMVSIPKEEKVNPKPTQHKFSINALIETKALPISIIAALTTFAYASILSFISVYSVSIGLSEVASYFFLVYAVAMLVSRPYVGKRFDKLGQNSVVIPGLLLCAIGLGMLGFGTVTPILQTMAVQSTSPSRSGHATATYFTFFTFFDTGIAAGSFILGHLVSSVGFQKLYFICAILIIVVIGMYLLVQSKKNYHRLKRSKKKKLHAVKVCSFFFCFLNVLKSKI